MKLRPLGTSEIKITPIIMGTWQAGKSMWTDIDDKESERAIRAAFDAGITTFDTAEVYGNGHSERVLGKALEGIRQETVIATKVFSNHLKYNQVIGVCERALKNLRTDYIDLFQIHWPPGSFGHVAVPMGDNPQMIIIPSIMAATCATIVGVTTVKLIQSFNRKRKAKAKSE